MKNEENKVNAESVDKLVTKLMRTINKKPTRETLAALVMTIGEVVEEVRQKDPDAATVLSGIVMQTVQKEVLPEEV